MNPGERIQELADQVVALRDAYYSGSPQVADAEYDAIEDELRGLIAANPELAPDPNPLEQVGGPSVLHAPVRHSRPMLSLEKATRPEQVAAFFDRFPGQPMAVMPKLDGLSLAVIYEDGRLVRAVTRGDGTTGDDVTFLVRALVDGVPERIDAPGRVEVRGEAVMLRSTFAAYNAAHPDKPLINPRGAAAGTLRAKDPATVAERRLQLFAFDLYTSADAASADLEQALSALGLAAADMRLCADAEQAQAVIAGIEQSRNTRDYDLDGAVLRLANRDAYGAAGTRSNSPRGALAYKFAAEEKTTVLADVVWDVGKTGKIAPVAHLEPVFVGGTTVTRATLANQEVIKARGIRIGDTVLVRRAGDVIPFVAGVLDESKRTGDEREIIPPTRCPSCDEPLTEQGNSRELFCTNASCPAQTTRRLIHWASRAAADIEAVGPVWIERLAESGDLENPSDFYTLTKERLLEFDRIGEVSAARMIESIAASRGVGLRRALIGLAIPWPPRAPPPASAAPASPPLRPSPTPPRRNSPPSTTSVPGSPLPCPPTSRACAPRSTACVPSASPSTCAPRTCRPWSRPALPWPARPSSSPAPSPTPAPARRSPAPPSSACARRPAPPSPPPSPPTPTCSSPAPTSAPAS